MGLWGGLQCLRPVQGRLGSVRWCVPALSGSNRTDACAAAAAVLRLLRLCSLQGSLHAGGGPFLAEGDVEVAAHMFQISQETNSVSSFVERLQKEGLMAGGSGGGGGGGKDGKGAAGGGGSSSSSSDDGGGDGSKGDAAAKSAATGLAKPAKRLAVPQLSRALAHKHARDGIVIVTWANSHFYDFVLNWVHHMRVHDISNYMVGAMDDDIGQVGAGHTLGAASLLRQPARQPALSGVWLGACEGSPPPASCLRGILCTHKL